MERKFIQSSRPENSRNPTPLSKPCAPRADPASFTVSATTASVPKHRTSNLEPRTSNLVLLASFFVQSSRFDVQGSTFKVQGSKSSNKRTSNIQHRTSNAEVFPISAVRCSVFSVRCSMFGVPAIFYPESDGCLVAFRVQRSGFNVQQQKNIEHRTSNAQHPTMCNLFHWELDVGCWMFDVQCRLQPESDGCLVAPAVFKTAVGRLCRSGYVRFVPSPPIESPIYDLRSHRVNRQSQIQKGGVAHVPRADS